MDERQSRLGRNESLFREVNERLDDLNEAFATVADDFEIVCECGDGGCAEQILVPTADYARVRKDRTLFILVPGHEDATVEVVVNDRERYVVVRKRAGGPSELAAEHAPE